MSNEKKETRLSFLDSMKSEGKAITEKFRVKNNPDIIGVMKQGLIKSYIPDYTEEYKGSKSVREAVVISIDETFNGADSVDDLTDYIFPYASIVTRTKDHLNCYVEITYKGEIPHPDNDERSIQEFDVKVYESA